MDGKYYLVTLACSVDILPFFINKVIDQVFKSSKREENSQLSNFLP